MRMDETLAVFGVVKGPNGTRASQVAVRREGTTLPLLAWLREGGRGVKLTQP